MGPKLMLSLVVYRHNQSADRSESCGGILKRAVALVPIAGEARVLHHPHGDEAALGVDCHVRGERAAVAVRIAIRRPAQAVTFLNRVAGLLARHLLHRCFAIR